MLTGISQHQRVSPLYLGQSFGRLRRYEIVGNVCDSGGGYSLTRHADNVTVADIIATVDEPLGTTRRGGGGNCGDEERVSDCTGHCVTRDLWTTLNRRMVEYLDSILLQDLASQ